MDYIYRFVYDEPDLHPWNESYLIVRNKLYDVLLHLVCQYFIEVFFFLYCILGFGVHEQSMQDSFIGTHMAVSFASFLPFTHLWHFSQAIPPHLPLPLALPFSPQ